MFTSKSSLYYIIDDFMLYCTTVNKWRVIPHHCTSYRDSAVSVHLVLFLADAEVLQQEQFPKN